MSGGSDGAQPTRTREMSNRNSTGGRGSPRGEPVASRVGAFPAHDVSCPASPS
jgi:hypothetical protein